MKLIDRAAIIGGGVIGAGWIARLIENGIDVKVYDPAEDAEQKVEAVLRNSRHAYAKLTSAPRQSGCMCEHICSGRGLAITAGGTGPVDAQALQPGQVGQTAHNLSDRFAAVTQQ